MTSQNKLQYTPISQMDFEMIVEVFTDMAFNE